jgi:CBS domain-containing protein
MTVTRSTITIAEAMHPGVVTCPPETPLESVAELMADRHIHCVVVFTDEQEGASGRHWGVVSDLDLAAAIDDLETKTAGTAAATPVVMITPEQPVRRAAELMTQYRTAHLIVVDPGSSRPIGVISTLDVARAVAPPPAR